MMTKFEKVSIFLLRVGMGWLMFYAGITKILDPNWTAAGYLNNAKTFTGLFQWFATSGNVGWVNFVNEWGLTFLGVSLLLGMGVRLSSLLGVVLMLLYYFPVLQFPVIPPHSYIVDEHIIYALMLLYFAAAKVGRVWGLEDWCSNLPICSKFPRLREWLG